MYRDVFRWFFLSALLFGVGCRSTDVRPERLDPGSVPSASASDAPSPRPGSAAPSPTPATEPQGVLTLRAAAALALMHNPDLKTFPYEMRAAESRVLQAGLRPNPEMAIEMSEFGGSDTRSGFDAAETSIQLGQLIEVGGKRDKREAVAAVNRELVQWDYESARLDTLREVAGAFVAVLAAQERLALTQQMRDLSNDAEAAVAQRVEAGKDSPVDDLRANVALSRSRIEARKARTKLATARHRLAAAWGGHTPTFEKVTGDLYQLSPPPPFDRAAERLRENPDLGRWETEERKRRAALRLEKARASPDVTVSGGVQRFEETDDEALIFGLSIPIPIFDRNQGGIAEATANLARTRQRSEAVKVRMQATLSAAVNTLAAAHDETSILRSDVLPTAQQAFDAARRGYEQGKFDYLYVLDAQRTLFETKTQLIDSAEAYHKARADVERLIGRSLDMLEPSGSAGPIPAQTTKEDSHER
ncbi:MAG: TolC family protein [Sedimentisphaerales bacterium]|nr:TolC family protein [Sedimentisphaerales bacterium]